VHDVVSDIVVELALRTGAVLGTIEGENFRLRICLLGIAHLDTVVDRIHLDARLSAVCDLLFQQWPAANDDLDAFSPIHSSITARGAPRRR
jgi:hypothetical protein